jgi:hypothetical protein
MTAASLLEMLPPFEGKDMLITDRQDVDDIIQVMLSRHKKFAAAYDTIAAEFMGGSVKQICKRLYDWARKNIPYVVEDKERQTVRSPSGILATARFWGGDCKHYASFIAGVLDAIGRLTGNRIDWCYRFAEYEIGTSDPDTWHVFVVVYPDTNYELWVDPVFNTFNTRTPRPWHWEDQKPKSMALYQVSGIGKALPFVSTTIVRRSQGTMTPGDNDCASCGGASVGDASSNTAALDAVEPGLGTAINQGLSTLPDGDVKDFLQGLLSNPQQAIMQLIKGRTYTSGDYKLAEYYMRNILGMSNVQRWEQVPDGYVPQGWAFFTTALGIRIRTSDDLDMIAGYADTPQQRAANYFTREPLETQDISHAAAERAAYLVGEPGFNGLFSIYKNRDTKWPLSIFKAQDYIYPIPGVLQNGPLFTGTHPITGQVFVDGYPNTYTGTRYTNQLYTTLQSATTSVPGATTPGTPGTPAVPGSGSNAASQFAALNPLLLLAVGGTAIYMLTGKSHPPAHRRKVSGVKKKSNTGAVVALALLGVGIYIASKNNEGTTTTTPAIAPGENSPTDTPSLPSAVTNPTQPINVQPGTIAPLPGLQVHAIDTNPPVDVAYPILLPGTQIMPDIPYNAGNPDQDTGGYVYADYSGGGGQQANIQAEYQV